MRKSLVFLAIAAVSVKARAQTPVSPSVTSVVNSASYSAPIVPRSLITIFGTGLAPVTQAAARDAMPLPTNIGGTSVTVNGFAAPLLYVSPTQINAQMPAEVKAGNESYSATTLMVHTPVSTSGFTFPVFSYAPGFFSSDSSGCGQAAALNITPDGAVSVNSPSNSAAPGDFLAVFGTGIGSLSNQPADGTAPSGADKAAVFPSFFFGSDVDSVFFGGSDLPRQSTAASYLGAAPTLVGVDQMNFQIPSGSRNGCAVPVMIGGPVVSQVVSVSVNANRGQCVDPPSQSYGRVTLVKTVASGSTDSDESDEFDAIFPSAPGLVEPATPSLTSASDTTTIAMVSNPRACTLPGYASLDAGTIQIQPVGKGITSIAGVKQVNGVAYQASLPIGYVGSGQYTIYTSPSSSIPFQATMAVGSPITVQTDLSPGTVVSAKNPPTITWTGGDSNSVVKITLIGDPGQVGYASDVYYVPVSAGSLKLSIFGLGPGVEER